MRKQYVRLILSISIFYIQNILTMEEVPLSLQLQEVLGPPQCDGTLRTAFDKRANTVVGTFIIQINSEDHELIIFDGNTEEKRITVPYDPELGLCESFYVDGPYLIVSQKHHHGSKCCHVHDIDIGTSLFKKTLENHQYVVLCKEGKILVEELSLGKRELSIWETATGKELVKFSPLRKRFWTLGMISPQRFVGRYYHTIFQGPDGDKIVLDAHWFIGDCSTGELRTFQLDNAECALKVLAGKIISYGMHEDNNLLVSLHDQDTGEVRASCFGGPCKGPVSQLSISALDDIVVFCSSAITLWNISSGRQYSIPHASVFWCQQCGNRLFTASRNGTLCIWDRTTGELLSTFSQLKPLKNPAQYFLHVMSAEKIVIKRRGINFSQIMFLDMSLMRLLDEIKGEQAEALLRYLQNIKGKKRVNGPRHWQDIIIMLKAAQNSNISASALIKSKNSKCALQ